jgi:hypothetical protein
MQNLEEKAQYLLAQVAPKIIWNSAITEATELYPASNKAKIWVTGERAAHIRDESGRLTPMPGQPWPRPSANAAIDVRGIYHMANGTARLTLQVTAVQLGEDTYTPYSGDPFAQN